MTEETQPPALGDIVIYVDHDGDDHAAIVTSVCDPEECGANTVGLVAFSDFGMQFHDHVSYGNGMPGNWSWPPTSSKF